MMGLRCVWCMLANKIVFCNQIFAKLYGKNASDIIGTANYKFRTTEERYAAVGV